jgi:hypothetical protein
MVKRHSDHKVLRIRKGQSRISDACLASSRPHKLPPSVPYGRHPQSRRCHRCVVLWKRSRSLTLTYGTTSIYHHLIKVEFLCLLNVRRSVPYAAIRSGDHLNREQHQESDKERGGDHGGIGYLVCLHQQFFRHQVQQGRSAERKHGCECETR